MNIIKNIFQKLPFLNSRLWLLGGLVLLLASCEKEEVQTILKVGSPAVLSLNNSTVVLTKDNADKDALTITWTKPDYGFNAGVSYSLLFDKKGGGFSKPVTVDMGLATKKMFINSELNGILLSLGLEPEKAADVDVKVVSIVQGIAENLSSSVISLKATPYSTKIDLSSVWGVVGSAAANGWNGPDMPFYKTDKANVFKAYVTLSTGEMKFRQNNKWDVNLGDNGADGTTESGGANIAVTAGTYVITLDIANNKYSIDKYSWGVVGSAAVNGWNGPDMQLTYNPYTDTWNGILSLADGEMKFRLNNDWGTNYGDTKADFILDAGGDNIKISKGTYKISVNITAKTYTLTDSKLWGIVGDATPTGWNGPDTKFTYDFINEVWKLSNITLTAGEIKFRLGDDWGVNYGSEVEGKLKAGGANIKVEAGTYDFVLDFRDPNNPLYTKTKK